VAKALGSPSSLTTEEFHQACGWPPPGVHPYPIPSFNLSPLASSSPR
jgi:hypothetical protein